MCICFVQSALCFRTVTVKSKLHLRLNEITLSLCVYYFVDIDVCVCVLADVSHVPLKKNEAEESRDALAKVILGFALLVIVCD